MFQGVEAIARFDPVDQRGSVTVFLGIYQVDTGLIQRHRIGGCQDANVVQIRLRRITVTVAVDGDTVHHIDVDDPLPAAQIIGH